MLSLHCPSCGGTNIFYETKKIPTFCGFCGAHLPDMTQFVKDSLKVETDKKQLELDKQRHDMEIETINKEIKKEKSKRFELIIVTLTVIFLSLLFYWFITSVLNIRTSTR